MMHLTVISLKVANGISNQQYKIITDIIFIDVSGLSKTFRNKP